MMVESPRSRLHRHDLAMARGDDARGRYRHVTEGLEKQHGPEYYGKVMGEWGTGEWLGTGDIWDHAG